MDDHKAVQLPSEGKPRKILRVVGHVSDIFGFLTGPVAIAGVITIFYAYINEQIVPLTWLALTTENLLKVAAAGITTAILSMMVGFFYLVRYKRTKYRLRQATNLIERYQACEVHYRVMHAAHAESDKSLFDGLFYQVPDSRKDMGGRLAHAASVVDNNINFILNIAARLVKEFTGHECAISLWLFESGRGNTNINDHPALSRLRQNTESKFENVTAVPDWLEGDLYPAIRDILLNASETRYMTILSPLNGLGRKKYYMLLGGIPIFEDRSSERRNPTLTKAALSIETQADCLDVATCRHQLRLISSRLSIMLYRENSIGERLKLVDTQQNKGG